MTQSNKSHRAGVEIKNLDLVASYLENEINRFSSMETQHMTANSNFINQTGIDTRKIFQQLDILFSEFYPAYRLEVNRKYEKGGALLESTKTSFMEVGRRVN